MNLYTPLFSKIVDSSLWQESDLVVKIFLTMIAKQDRDHVVRGNAFNIGKWANKSEAEAIEALNILEAPDKRRIEPQPFDGRRVEKMKDGYLILNGRVYQDLMRAANRRDYQRDKQAEYRANKKSMIPQRDIERRQTPEDQIKKAQYMHADGQYPTYEAALQSAKEFSAKESAEQANPPY